MAVKGSGIEGVIKNLNKALKKIEGGTMKGLIRASIAVRRSMENNAPSIPVDLGNLRASYFSVTSEGNTQAGSVASFQGDDAGKLGGDHSSVVTESKAGVLSKNPAIRMGFSAFYAVFVHENVGAEFSQPEDGSIKAATGAKFFEAALKREAPKILRIIEKEAKVI
jgi:hypothetical protein